jgi:hypothetical protein
LSQLLAFLTTSLLPISTQHLPFLMCKLLPSRLLPNGLQPNRLQPNGLQPNRLLLLSRPLRRREPPLIGHYVALLEIGLSRHKTLPLPIRQEGRSLSCVLE